MRRHGNAHSFFYYTQFFSFHCIPCQPASNTADLLSFQSFLSPCKSDPFHFGADAQGLFIIIMIYSSDCRNVPRYASQITVGPVHNGMNVPLFSVRSIVDADTSTAWIRRTSPIPPWNPSNQISPVSEHGVTPQTCPEGVVVGLPYRRSCRSF